MLATAAKRRNHLIGLENEFQVRLLESGSDQRSAMEHAISLLRYTVDWLDEDRAEALASELEGRVAEGDEAMKP